MSRPYSTVAAALSVAVAVAAATLWPAASRSRPNGDKQAAEDEPVLSEAEMRDRDIDFYRRRADEDSLSASDRAQLAGLYLQRARASGDFADYGRAERLARRSLSLRAQHNAKTFALLASALMARHAFRDALDEARRVDSLDPGVASHVALRGEIELELGEYEAANAHFSSIRFDGEDFTVAARLARWRELTGHVDAARRLLRLAAAKADRRADLPHEQVAWFHVRLGEIELRVGRLDAADSAFHRALDVFASDYRALGGLARLAATRGQWRLAIAFGDRAIAIQLDPGTLGVMSEASSALGDTARAAEYKRAMAVSALAQPGPIHRAWGIFLLDHGTPEDVRRVLAKCRAELRTRHDVYAYDLLAWALHKQGHDASAHEAMQRALAQHTEDRQLTHHAAVIARAIEGARGH